MIPLFSPARQNELFLPQIQQAITKVLASGQYILGPEVELFEQSLAPIAGYRHAVGCSSGTEALALCLHSLGLSPGDEVITPAFSFVASANVIAWAGLTPRFADVELQSGNLDIQSVKSLISPKTRAIISVDLYGRQSPIAQLREIAKENKLFIIEDGAQSLGVPNQGADLYTTSFYPTKNVGAIGDAGAVLTDNTELADRVRKLSRQGERVRDSYDHVGTNARLDALQAAILSLKIGSLRSWIKRRHELAGRYRQHWQDWEKSETISLPAEANGVASVWSMFTLRVNNGQRAQLIELLRQKNIGFGVYYSAPLHTQKDLVRFCTQPCPNAEKLATQVLSLPLYPELEEKEVAYLLEQVSECLRRLTSS